MNTVDDIVSDFPWRMFTIYQHVMHTCQCYHEHNMESNKETMHTVMLRIMSWLTQTGFHSIATIGCYWTLPDYVSLY